MRGFFSVAEPIGGANGDEPFSSDAIATSVAAHPRRSLLTFGHSMTLAPLGRLRRNARVDDLEQTEASRLDTLDPTGRTLAGRLSAARSSSLVRLSTYLGFLQSELDLKRDVIVVVSPNLPSTDLHGGMMFAPITAAGGCSPIQLPRASVSHSRRSTSPRFSMRLIWCETRLFSHDSFAPRSRPRLLCVSFPQARPVVEFAARPPPGDLLLQRVVNPEQGHPRCSSEPQRGRYPKTAWRLFGTGLLPFAGVPAQLSLLRSWR